MAGVGMKSYPILFDSTTKDFTTNGIGILSDAISAFVVEGRNSNFDFTLTYPIGGTYANDLVNGRILRMIPNTRYSYHNFIITNVEKDVSGYLRVTGSSASVVELGDNLIKDIKGKYTAIQALNMINTKSIDAMSYYFSSDLTEPREVFWEHRNPLNALVGQEGSAVDIWGGELLRQDKSISLLKNRGRDNGYQIRPGTNLKGFRMTTDTKPLVTRILPTATIQEDGKDEPTLLIGKVVESDHINKYTRRPIIMVDFTDDNITDTATLNTRAASYFKSLNKGVDFPKVTVNADLIALQDTSEFNKYKILEDVALCDMVTVYVAKYNIDVTIKVVEVTYDVINGRNSNVVLGDKTLSPVTALAIETTKNLTEVSEGLKQYIITNPSGQKIIYGGPRPDPVLYKKGDVWYEKISESDWNMYIHNGTDWELIIGDSIFRELDENLAIVEKEAKDAQDRADAVGVIADAADKKAQDALAKTTNLDTRLKGSETDIVAVKAEQGTINTKITGLRTDLDNIDLATRNLALGTRTPKVVIGTTATAGSDNWTTATTYTYSNGNNFRDLCSYYNITPNDDLTVSARIVLKNASGKLIKADFHSNFIYSLFIFTGVGSSYRQFGALREGALVDGKTDYYVTGTMKPQQKDIDAAPDTYIQSWLRRLPNGYTLTVSEYILTIGSRDVSYSLAPEDVIDAQKFSEFQQTINGFQTTVESRLNNINVGDGNIFLRSGDTFNSKNISGREFLTVGSWDMAELIDQYGLDIEYTLSVDIKADKPGYVYVYSQNGLATKYSIGKHPVQATTEWVRHYFLIKPTLSNASEKKAQLAFYGTYGTGVFPSARKAMFTVGNVKKEWQVSTRELATQTQITQLSDTIVMTNKQVDALGKTQQTQYTQLSDMIALTNKDVNALDQKQESQYLQLSNLIQLKVETIGSDNMVESTSNLTSGDLADWYKIDSAYPDMKISLTGVPSSQYKNGQNMIQMTDMAISPHRSDAYSKPFKVQGGVDYAAQVKAFGDANTESFTMFLRCKLKNGSYQGVMLATNLKATTTLTTYNGTAKLPKDAIEAQFMFAGIRKKYGSTTINFIEPIVVEGTSVAGYNPGSSVVNEATKAALNILNDSIKLKVQKGNVRSQINLEANNLLFDINGNILNITPTTTYIANATIKNAMIESLSASKLTAGTIDAKVINVINLNATNITSGTLNAINITASTITSSTFTTVASNSITTLKDGITSYYNGKYGAIGTIGHNPVYGNALLTTFNDSLYIKSANRNAEGLIYINLIRNKVTVTLTAVNSGFDFITARDSYVGRAHIGADGLLALAGTGGVSFNKVESTGISNMGYWTPSTLTVRTGLNVLGSKNAVHKTSVGYVATPAYETAESYLGDIGTGVTNHDGYATISIDKLFNETVNTLDCEYHVFIQSYTQGSYISVVERLPNSFTVQSTLPNTGFVYEIKAKRKGYEHLRLNVEDI